MSAAAFPRTRLPDGAVDTRHPAADGAVLRTLHWPVPQSPRRRILFMGGKRDFIERHAESYHRLLADGHALAALDWRDQGLSARGSVPTAELFAHMERDLLQIVRWAEETLGKPLTLAGHSMGGHMALRALAFHESVRAASERAILFAPMLGIAGPLPPWMMSAAAHANVRFGRGESYPPGQLPYGPEYRSERRRLLLTSDRSRFDEGFGWIDAEPGLAAGGATWGWLAAAQRSIAQLRAPGLLERVDAPVLLLVGTEERVVAPAAIVRAAARLPNARLEIVEGGHHELQLDSDLVQAQIWRAVRGFLG